MLEQTVGSLTTATKETKGKVVFGVDGAVGTLAQINYSMSMGPMNCVIATGRWPFLPTPRLRIDISQDTQNLARLRSRIFKTMEIR